MKQKPSEIFEGENSSLRKAFDVSVNSKENSSKIAANWEEMYFKQLDILKNAEALNESSNTKIDKALKLAEKSLELVSFIRQAIYREVIEVCEENIPNTVTMPTDNLHGELIRNATNFERNRIRTYFASKLTELK